MNKHRIYKKLKNGKELVEYTNINNARYTIRIQLEEDIFQLHTYIFEGNDVFDDKNYKDEKIRKFETFESLIKQVEKNFLN